MKIRVVNKSPFSSYFLSCNFSYISEHYVHSQIVLVGQDNKFYAFTWQHADTASYEFSGCTVFCGSLLLPTSDIYDLCSALCAQTLSVCFLSLELQTEFQAHGDEWAICVHLTDSSFFVIRNTALRTASSSTHTLCSSLRMRNLLLLLLQSSPVYLTTENF